jgi:hypothetical protein
MKISNYPFSYRTKILKNGATHPHHLIQKAVDFLVELRSSNPVIFFELVKKCRFANHELQSEAAQLLTSKAIIKNNEVDDVVKDVVLSSVSGRMLNELEVTSPIYDGTPPCLLTL